MKQLKKRAKMEKQRKINKVKKLYVLTHISGVDQLSIIIGVR